MDDTGFPDNYFDVVLGRHVLEHTHDLDATMREFKRILKPDGYVAMITPHATDDPEPAHLVKLGR